MHALSSATSTIYDIFDAAAKVKGPGVLSWRLSSSALKCVLSQSRHLTIATVSSHEPFKIGCTKGTSIYSFSCGMSSCESSVRAMCLR